MAYHGHRVKLFDNNIEALNSAHEKMEEDKKQLREEGLLPHKNFIVSWLSSINKCINLLLMMKFVGLNMLENDMNYAVRFDCPFWIVGSSSVF